MSGLQSSLARHVSSGNGDVDPARAKAAEAWHREGIVLLRPEWLPGWAQQEQLRHLAQSTFGKRKGGGR